METSQRIASYLLQSKAIIIDPANPFTWSSGLRSPVYCDNRKTLSYPEIRHFIRDAFIREIHAHFGHPDIIAGVATGAIAHAALVAEKMDLPFIYIRSAQKSHGTGNLIEGDAPKEGTAVIIEDLVSTGGSSLAAAGVLHKAGLEVLGMLSIFTYGLSVAEENFRQAGIKLVSLGNFDALIEEAERTGYIRGRELEILSQWKKDPEHWKNFS